MSEGPTKKQLRRPAPDKHLPPESCPRTGKRSYHKRTEARAALVKLKREGRSVIAFYRCPHCHDYHLTSQEQY